MKGDFAVAYTILGAALLLLLHFHHVEGFEIEFGACPPLTLPGIAVDPFVLGRSWFEVRRIPSTTENGLICVRYAFGAAAGAPVQHSLTIIGTKEVDRTTVINTGTVTQTAAGAASVPPSFNQWISSFKSNTMGFNHLPSPFPKSYSVLGMDQTAVPPAWIVLYSCAPVERFNIKTSVILSTTPTLTATQLAAALSVVSQFGLQPSRYIAVDQSTC